MNRLGPALLLVFALLSQQALAGECASRVDRQPLPGKEAEAWGPYGNRNPTAEVKQAASAAECKEQAVKNCPIKRKDILKSKTVKALFNGAPLEGGADLCK